MTSTTDKPATKRPRRMPREPQADADHTSDTSTTEAASPEAPATKQTKASLVLGMLSRREGVTLDQMVEATGWLPHTTRAALTGLKKKGYTIERRKVGEQNTYFRV